MRGNPQVEVSCDECGAEEFVGLTSLARGGYDERNMDGVLEGKGWKIADGKDICPDCQEDINEGQS